MVSRTGRFLYAPSIPKVMQLMEGNPDWANMSAKEFDSWCMHISEIHLYSIRRVPAFQTRLKQYRVECLIKNERFWYPDLILEGDTE
jgi:hypothetical protein